MRYRFDRHKKACNNCKYAHCTDCNDCPTCKINPTGNILSCPCLNFDDSPKHSRCEYFERNEEVENEQ